MLGPDALEGANYNIGEDDPHKQGAAGRAHQNHRQGQGKVQQVEKGEHILPDNLPLGLGLYARVPVMQALPNPLLHLGWGKALLGVRVKPLDLPGCLGSGGRGLFFSHHTLCLANFVDGPKQALSTKYTPIGRLFQGRERENFPNIFLRISDGHFCKNCSKSLKFPKATPRKAQKPRYFVEKPDFFRGKIPGRDLTISRIAAIIPGMKQLKKK